MSRRPRMSPAGAGTATRARPGTLAVPVRASRGSPRLRPVHVAVLVLAVFSPWFGIPRLTTALLTTVCLFGIAASGLNLMFGYAGMLSLGNGIFIGLGGYTAAIASQRWHWPLLASLVCGIVVTLAVALLLGLMLVRLSGHYFAVATLGLAMAFNALLVAIPGVTGGGSGMTTTPSLPLGSLTVESSLQWYVLSGIVLAVLLLFFTWVVAGKRGRVLRLVRQDELAAEVLGVPVFRAKLLAFTLGAAFAGVAGSLLFVSQGLIVPDSVGILTSVQLAMLVVIGGPGYRLGGLVGAFTVLWLQALLNSFGNYELLVYGAILLAVVFYLRPGIEGALVELWQRFARPRLPQRDLPPPSLQAPARQGTAGAVAAEEAPAAPRGGLTGLEVRSARRSFGGVNAVDGVSLKAPAGRVTALIGANGAGKSTLLNLISGVERLDAGTILLDGHDISHAPPADRTRRGVVRTFQVPRLVDELNVVENMVLGHEAAEKSLIRRQPPMERAAMDRARATLVQLSLGSLADRPASSLGTGERKYVEVARAVFTGASTLLLDEPAVGLSADEVTQLKNWLADVRSSGAAVVVIDHNMDFISELADYVYSMETGRIAWEGIPAAMSRGVPGPAAPASSSADGTGPPLGRQT